MTKHLIITLEDARFISTHLPDGDLKNRLMKETGADIEIIAAELKHFGACITCRIEGQEHSCIHSTVNKIGRRLDRLLQRADNPNYVPHDSQ